MAFVIMHLGTKRLYPGHSYSTLRGAKAAATRMSHKTGTVYVAMSAADYHSKFNKMVAVKSLMTGDDVLIPLNDVGTCVDPSTERYWSM